MFFVMCHKKTESYGEKIFIYFIPEKPANEYELSPVIILEVSQNENNVTNNFSEKTLKKNLLQINKM